MIIKRIISLIVIAFLLFGCGINAKRQKSGDPIKKIVLKKIPPRPAGAITGKEFSLKIDGLLFKDREEAIFNEISKGNIPDFLRTLKPVNTSFKDSKGINHTATYYVMPDYLAIGSEEDFFRIPMSPMTGQRLADIFDCSLPTKKISDDVYKAAEGRFDPKPLTEKREAISTFLQHNNIIEVQRKEHRLGELTAGIKKDVIITNKLSEKPNRVAIYGWHKLDGIPIQPVTIIHVNIYVDYSHGIRLVYDKVMVDGKERALKDILSDPDLCGLLSDEGVIKNLTYPKEIIVNKPKAK